MQIKKTWKIKLDIANRIHEFDMIIRNSTEQPTKDAILNEYSSHYHKSTGRGLPHTTEITSIEEI
jgi:hypothetical protein